MFTDDKFLQVCERYQEIHLGKPLAALTARQDEVLNRVAELQGYARRSGTQDAELDQLHAEQTVLDVAIADAKVAVRSQRAAERAEKIAEITRTAQDPANLERPAGAPYDAPAVVKGLGAGWTRRPRRSSGWATRGGWTAGARWTPRRGPA
jgi:hypothetical protein